VATEDFFVERQDQSEVKSQIVVRMFDAWSTIVGGTAQGGESDRRLAYIDLYAGPGLYEDGSKSTPLLMLEKIIAKPMLAGCIVTMFNDVDADHINTLTKAIAALPGI
jgi:three-Cys-motif partner protein